MTDPASFEPWVQRALARWPNVPMLFGWLSLDRRGRWRIRGEVISRPQIIDTIAANYAADAHGRWFFQNGPQRGYVSLEYTPQVLRHDGSGGLVTHGGRPVRAPSGAWLDEQGALVLMTEHGAGVLDDADLAWALERIERGGAPASEADLLDALAQPGGSRTALQLHLGATLLALGRLDAAALPSALGFVREPQPLPGERVAGPAPAD